MSGYARASYDLEQRGQVGEATALMQRALDVAVSRYDIAFCRNQLGDLALSIGDTATAADQYTAGLQADPTSITLQRGQARLAAMTGRTADALSAYAALTRRSPTPGYLLEYAELLRANGRDADAQTQLRLATAAHQLFTGNGGVDGLTGAALAEATGRPADALAEAQAEWQRRQFADVADILGWTLHLNGRDAEALPYAQRAFDTGAQSAPYAYHLGIIQLALGDRAGARANLTRALEISPQFSPLDAPRARTAWPDWSLMKRLLLVSLGAAALFLMVPAAPASAHPLGNFSVNQYLGLTLHPDRVDATAAVDFAEIPTLQDRPAVDTSGDGTVSDDERSSYAAATCRQFASAVSRPSAVRAFPSHSRFFVLCVRFRRRRVGGVRLGCALTAPASLGSATALSVTNGYLADRVGWREMTAVGDGVGLVDSPLPTTSVSNELRNYPPDLLASSLDVRSATLKVTPGPSSGGASGLPPAGSDPISRLDGHSGPYVPGRRRRPAHPARRAARGGAGDPARRRPRRPAGPRQDGARGLPRRQAGPPPRRPHHRRHGHAHPHRRRAHPRCRAHRRHRAGRRGDPRVARPGQRGRGGRRRGFHAVRRHPPPARTRPRRRGPLARPVRATHPHARFALPR